MTSRPTGRWTVTVAAFPKWPPASMVVGGGTLRAEGRYLEGWGVSQFIRGLTPK